MVKTFLGNVRQLIISLYLATIRFLINYKWKFPSQLEENVIKKSTEFRSFFSNIQRRCLLLVKNALKNLSTHFHEQVFLGINIPISIGKTTVSISGLWPPRPGSLVPGLGTQFWPNQTTLCTQAWGVKDQISILYMLNYTIPISNVHRPNTKLNLSVRQSAIMILVLCWQNSRIK